MEDETPLYRPATQAVHGDDRLNSSTDVAPSLHVSTTFRYTDDISKLKPIDSSDVSAWKASPCL